MTKILKILIFILITTLILNATLQKVNESYVIVQTAGDTYLGNELDQTYSLNPFLISAGESIVILDQGGLNTIELVGGLTITSSIVTSNEILLHFNNGASVNIRGANIFTFDVGANKVASVTGTEQNFTTFVTSTLGLEHVPTLEEVAIHSEVVVQIIAGDIQKINEPYYYQQWYLNWNKVFYTQNNIDKNAHIHPSGVLNQYGGEGIKIAVIDDGLDVTHEDLVNSIIYTYDITTKSSNVSHTNKNDYHGTAVTGVIGARVNSIGIQGIASKSQIIFLKYQENMSDSETIELFNKAQEFGADIINCSWGTYDVSDAVRDKIQNLANNGREGKGIVIVFAVGNDDQDMGNDESSIPEVIAVGASDRDNLRAWYSNYGNHLDIIAPGGYYMGITTIDNMGDNGIASIVENYLLYDDINSFMGTSASAPIVSGVIALMLERDSTLTRVDIENILKENADKIGNLNYENNRNNYYGYGKINLSKIWSCISN